MPTGHDEKCQSAHRPAGPLWITCWAGSITSVADPLRNKKPSLTTIALTAGSYAIVAIVLALLCVPLLLILAA